MDELQGGMKEKLLEKLLELFTAMPDKAEAEISLEAKPEEGGMGTPTEQKEEIC